MLIQIPSKSLAVLVYQEVSMGDSPRTEPLHQIKFIFPVHLRTLIKGYLLEGDGGIEGSGCPKSPLNMEV